MVNDFIKELKTREKHHKEFVEKMTYSTEYMDWLDAFTKRKGNFSTDSFLYDKSGLSDKDMEYVTDIQILFEEISEYCTENYLDPKKRDYGIYYSIMENGVGYNIGFDYGQGSCFYCERLEEPAEDALDFKHVRSGVKLPKTVIDEFELEKLSSLIKELYASGVSMAAITRTVEQTVQRINKQEDTTNNKKTK